MSLNIKHPEADKLARALVHRTGETLTEAIIKALRERLKREEGRLLPQSLEADLIEISQRCAALRDIDKRSPDEILGYNEQGLSGEFYGH